jgi:hypothetical protein
MRQGICSGILTWKGYSAGDLRRGGDGGVVVGHFGENVICATAGG